MENVIIYSIAAAVSLSVFLIFWLSTRLVSVVPEEDRTWNDTPPLGFRIVWWPIKWFAFYVTPLMSNKSREKRMMQLRQAGLDYTFNPSQFLSARIVWGFIFAGFLYWMLSGIGFAYLGTLPLGFLLGFFYPAIWLSDVVKLRRKQMLKALPFYLDIITLCVESGLNVNGALQQAVAKGPKGVLKHEFQRVLRDIRAGTTRSEALKSMAKRINHASIFSFTSSLIQAEATGMSLGPILRAQADQRRDERFMAAEKQAMEAPVKMLLPLIAFIFPCVFFIIFFPVAMRLMALMAS